MRTTQVLCTIPIALTLVSAVYQRLTGPTYAVRGLVVLGGSDIRYRLERSHDTRADQIVQVRVPDKAVTGEMKWRRFPASEPYQTALLVRRDDILEGALPRQLRAANAVVVLDTNTLILLFSQKNRHQATLVKDLIESKELLCLPDIVLSETEYILGTKYHRSRQEIYKVFRFF